MTTQAEKQEKRGLVMGYLKMDIDDNYINEMAEYYEKQGKQLQGMMDSYIDAIRKLTEDGIVQGDTADRLKSYLAYAERLKQVVMEASTEARDMVADYLAEICEQDQYRY